MEGLGTVRTLGGLTLKGLWDLASLALSLPLSVVELWTAFTPQCISGCKKSGGLIAIPPVTWGSGTDGAQRGAGVLKAAHRFTCQENRQITASLF